MKRRGLSRAEHDLWAFVARQVKPLPGKRIPVVAPQPSVAASSVVKSLAVKSLVAKTSTASAAVVPNPVKTSAVKPTAPPVLQHPPLVPIERRMVQRVNRGQKPVDGVIDLHGMRQTEAHTALIRFILRAHHDAAQLVLVVTGKGAPEREVFSENERGVLRRLVPIWLADPTLRRHVIGFEEAGRGHGGSGALYVRIRRTRST